MKKTLIAMATMLPTLGFTQGNGGITNENTSTKIEWIGHNVSGDYVVRVTNKQSCQVNIRVQWGGAARFRVKSIPSNTSDTFHIGDPPSPNCFLGAKPETACDRSTNLGTVELNVCQILPVTFKSIAGYRVGSRSIKLVFTAEEDANLRYYNIQYSFDGKNFKTVNVVFPNGIEGSKQYSVIVNY